VNAFHARKMAARWQAASPKGRPVLLRIDRKGGHGAANLTRALEEIADEWTFLHLAFDPAP
jgi:prolyl oligopeptidase PreP (S9A serine peptidase family)